MFFSWSTDSRGVQNITVELPFISPRTPPFVHPALFAQERSMRVTFRSALFLPIFVVLIAINATAQSKNPKLDSITQGRADTDQGFSRVIITTVRTASDFELDGLLERVGGVANGRLPLIGGHVVELPNGKLKALADDDLVARVSLDRPIVAANERTGATVGATAVRQQLGYDGTGITVAIIDSGVSATHDDLGATSEYRIKRFVDFVKNRPKPTDDYGHGTHVAGIVAGNGYDSNGARTGIAPGADLVVLRVLDATGVGRISDVITALDYVVANKDALNIRVVNLSIGAGVFESYDTDPLTLAAKRAVDAGIVVVAAAGNGGRDAQGRTQYRSIQAPGNAPWVLTVGASSHMGTTDRADDAMARFSSHGPGAIDHRAKPDIVAPGVGIESAIEPLSTLYFAHSGYLLKGTIGTPYPPYLSLSGTSMSAPVVSGTVALMLQANPFLTPNAVKAILQYTAETSPAYDPLTQGAGFLNARGAVDLSRYFYEGGAFYPSSKSWSTRLIWGNQLVQGGILLPSASAWALDVTWGDATTSRGEAVRWGVICDPLSCGTIGIGIGLPWGATCTSAGCSTVTWDWGRSFNVVWGAACGGADCAGGTSDGETVVWGSTDDETVVWGSSEGETVVWGSTDQETVVWGSGCEDPTCGPVIWPKD
jgi:serine protease AprX